MRANYPPIASFVQKCPSVPTYLFQQDTHKEIANLQFPYIYLLFKNALSSS